MSAGRWERIRHEATEGFAANRIIDLSLRYKGDVPEGLVGGVLKHWPQSEQILPAVFDEYTRTAMREVDAGNASNAAEIAHEETRSYIIAALVTLRPDRHA